MESTTTAYTKTFSIDLERANYHLKLKKRKRKRILVVLTIWILIFIYFITPLSKVNLKISGNVYYSDYELVKKGYINENNLWWLFNDDNAKKVLESYEYINNVEIKKSFFGTKMIVDEIYPVLKIEDKYVFNNGLVRDIEDYPNNDKISFITSFENVNDEDLNYLSAKYSRVDLKVRNKINRLEIVNDSNNYKFAKLFGYEEKIGFFVIKVDLVYLDAKFKENKYSKIIDEVSKNNVKYSEDIPCFVAYHLENEETFQIVEGFVEEEIS